MAKSMSKTLAAEIADRTLAIINPQNRAMALKADLQRHGFVPPPELPDHGIDRISLMEWLRATYPPR